MVRANTWENHMPLLPRDTIKNNPLFIVLAILAFLATLSLLSLTVSHQIAHTWSRNITHTATVQIKPDTQENGATLANSAEEILRIVPNIANVKILPPAYSQDLLRPWLGNIALPEDLPLPILIHIQIHPNQTLDIAALQNTFTQAGIRADIDTHHRWNKELKDKTRALQILTIIAMILILTAITSACIFAVRAKVMEQKILMHVLNQIGAPPLFTRKLFSITFALTSFKASSLGAIGAYLVLLVLSFFITGNNSGSLLPDFNIGLHTLFLAATIPVFTALIAGLSTWYTVIKTAKVEAVHA